MRDAAGAPLFKDMIDVVSSQGGGLYRYYWPPGVPWPSLSKARDSQRCPVDLPCRLSAAGAVYAARLIDLSETGAQICDAPPLSLESRGTVSLDDVAVPLPFVVRHTDNQGRLNVEFEATEPARLAISQLLERLQRSRAA